MRRNPLACRNRFAAAVLMLGAGCACAQIGQADPDWKEVAASPPALRTDKLVPLEMPSSILRWGVDPDSISIGEDGVVRYVVVASSAAAVNALYEGVRCSTGEVKLYARHAGSNWTPVGDAQWKPLHGNTTQAHSLLIARNGACIGNAANRTPREVARDLDRGADRRFRPELR